MSHDAIYRCIAMLHETRRNRCACEPCVPRPAEAIAMRCVVLGIAMVAGNARVLSIIKYRLAWKDTSYMNAMSFAKGVSHACHYIWKSAICAAR